MAANAQDRCAVLTLLVLFVIGVGVLFDHPTTSPGPHGGTARAKAEYRRAAAAELDQMLDNLLKFRPSGHGKCAPSRAPELDRAVFDTTKGKFVVELRPDLAPHGVEHFIALVNAGYYTGSEIPFWMVNHWATQIGSDERESARRRHFADLRDFPNRQNNRKDSNPCPDQRWDLGVVAMLGGPHTLIVRVPNDEMGKNEHDAPTGYVIEGIEVLRKLQEFAGSDRPVESKIFADGGLQYLRSSFPKVDFIKSVTLVRGANPVV